MPTADRIASYRKAATLHMTAAAQLNVAAGFAEADNADAEADAYATAIEASTAATAAEQENTP